MSAPCWTSCGPTALLSGAVFPVLPHHYRNLPWPCLVCQHFSHAWPQVGHRWGMILWCCDHDSVVLWSPHSQVRMVSTPCLPSHCFYPAFPRRWGQSIERINGAFMSRVCWWLVNLSTSTGFSELACFLALFLCPGWKVCFQSQWGTQADLFRAYEQSLILL